MATPTQRVSPAPTKRAVRFEFQAAAECKAAGSTGSSAKPKIAG